MHRLPLEKLRTRLETAEEISRDCQEILRTGEGRLDRLKLVLAPPN